MEQKQNGLSREYIIHPGETLAEVMCDNGFSQKDVAVRAGVSEKHISKVVNGLSNISATFAKKLEYVFSIKASFWMNLQSKYDQEVAEFEDINNITNEEVDVVKSLVEVIAFWKKKGLIKKELRNEMLISDVRNILQVSNLLNIRDIKYNAAYRLQNSSINIFVLYAWQRTCEILVGRSKVDRSLDVEGLRSSIGEIKNIMFESPDEMQSQLIEIFSRYGILFMVVPNFKGAPVQGLIKEIDSEKIIMCITIRNKYADIFWFTLFHEIGHILNGDMKNIFIDFENTDKEKERTANKFAEDCLINPTEYKEFINNADFSVKSIENFAHKQGVKDYIVYGRLMNDKKISWDKSYNRPRYRWVV